MLQLPKIMAVEHISIRRYMNRRKSNTHETHHKNPPKPHPPLEISGISGCQDWQVIKQACKHQPSKSLLRNLKEPRWIGIPNPNWAAAGIRNHGHGSIIRSGKHQPLGVEAAQSVEDTPQQLLSPSAGQALTKCLARNKTVTMMGTIKIVVATL